MSQKANNLIARLKFELGIKKDKDLCKLLDIKHNTLSTWKKRDTLDFNKILELCDKHNLDLNYIFFEEEEKKKEEQETIHNNALIVPVVQTKKRNKLNPFFNTHLINTNRNISIFYNQVRDGDKISGEIVVGQKISLKKILANELYVIEDKQNSFYLDRLVNVENQKLKDSVFRLENLNKDIGLDSILHIWQVLHQSKNILGFIDGLSPI
tara:strand:+ start:1776 stop:2405 length:630 start_codon:yes stop_codon:yes gene_type:complete